MPGENWSGHYDYLNRNKKKCKCEFSAYTKKEDVRSTLQRYDPGSNNANGVFTRYCNICNGWIHHNRYWAVINKFQEKK